MKITLFDEVSLHGIHQPFPTNNFFIGTDIYAT